jgi:hypothetical protein
LPYRIQRIFSKLLGGGSRRSTVFFAQRYRHYLESDAEPQLDRRKSGIFPYENAAVWYSTDLNECGWHNSTKSSEEASKCSEIKGRVSHMYVSMGQNHFIFGTILRGVPLEIYVSAANALNSFQMK